MNDGSMWNKHPNWKMKRNCKVCGSRRKSAANPDRICAKCWREIHS